MADPLDVIEALYGARLRKQLEARGDGEPPIAINPKAPKPRRVFGETNVRKLLKGAGMKRSHPGYRFFSKVLLSVMEKTNEQNRVFLAIGAELQRLAAPATLTPAAHDRVRQIAAAMLDEDDAPHFNAIRLGFHAAKQVAQADKRSRSGGANSGRARRAKHDKDLDAAAMALNRLEERNPFVRYTAKDVATAAGLKTGRVRNTFTMARVRIRATQLRSRLVKK